MKDIFLSSFLVEMEMFEFRYVLHKDFEIISAHMDTTKFSHSFVDSSFERRRRNNGIF